MAPPILRKMFGPRIRRFDPRAPLYVRRRISLGPDDNGVMRWLEPGALFDASSVKPMRLAGLFSSRHIAHESPIAAAVEPTATANGAPLPTVEPVTEPPKPSPPPRRARG